MKNISRGFVFLWAFSCGVNTYALFDAPCAFDQTKRCTLQRDLLNDKSAQGLPYYSATNLDHRITGELNVYRDAQVKPYADKKNFNAGQIALYLNKTNNAFSSGEIRTRANLTAAPFNAPLPSASWSTSELRHGYIEVIAKMPACTESDDNLCQTNMAPAEYSAGLWPAIRLVPLYDTNWPTNAEIDIAEAYQQSSFRSTLHFNADLKECAGNCLLNGFPVANITMPAPLSKDFHTWGFEWQPDPGTVKGGQIISGYLDNQRIWGPLRTDDLPGDASIYIPRAFANPMGGYYLNINLAVGGPFAGAPNSRLQGASMEIQSIKTYSAYLPQKTCVPPFDVVDQNANDTSAWNITFDYVQSPYYETVQFVQIRDSHKQILAVSAATDGHAIVPKTTAIPLYIYSMCEESISSATIYYPKVS